MYFQLSELLKGICEKGVTEKQGNLGFEDICFLKPEDKDVPDGSLIVLSRKAAEMDEKAFTDLISLIEMETPHIYLIPSGSERKLQECEGLHFASQIIALPTSLPSDVFNQRLYERFNAIVRNRLERYNEIRERFTIMSLKNDDLSRMIDYFAEVIDNPVAIYDEAFQVIYSTNPYLEQLGSLNVGARRIHLNEVQYYTRHRADIQLEDGRTERFSVLAFPISFDSRVCAYLFIMELNRSITRNDQIVLEIASSSILTRIKHDYAIQTIYTRNIHRFISAFSYGASDEDLTRMAAALGLPRKSHYHVAALRIRAEIHTSLRPDPTEGVINATLEDELLSVIQKIVKRHSEKAVAGMRKNRFIIVFPTPADSDEESAVAKLKALCNDIYRQLHLSYRSVSLMAGIGRRAPGFNSLTSAYDTALEALNYGNTIYADSTVGITVYEDKLILRLAGQVDGTEKLKNLISPRIMEMAVYDREHDSELLKTLEVYLNANCNARAAADNMFIHHKTMLYRLEKIESLFSVDLSSNEERLDLSLSLRIAHMLSEI